MTTQLTSSELRERNCTIWRRLIVRRSILARLILMGLIFDETDHDETHPACSIPQFRFSAAKAAHMARRPEKPALIGQRVDQRIDIFTRVIEVRRDSQPSNAKRDNNVARLEASEESLRRLVRVLANHDRGPLRCFSGVQNSVALIRQFLDEIFAQR